MTDEPMKFHVRFCSAVALTVSLVATGCSPADPATSTGNTIPSVGGTFAPPPTATAGTGVSAPPLVNTPVAGTGAIIAQPAAACPATIFQQKCKSCHDGRGTAGSPMGLVNYEDFQVAGKTNATLPVYKLVHARVHDAAKPMPMSGMLPAAELAVIDAWVTGGAKDCVGFTHATAGAAGISGGAAGGPPSTTGAAGGGATVPADLAQYLSPDGTYFIKAPPGDKPIGPDAKDAEFCFNLVSHGTQMPLPNDPSPFMVPNKEFYHAFDYKVPYTKTMVALSTKPIIDNAKVLHHWLLFHIMSDTGNDGSHADEIGLQIGKELVSGWAPGGNPPETMPGVGIEMPKAGGFMTLETHYFNNTGATAPDRSGVRLCMTSKIPPNVATLTWLGTENINIPAKAAAATATGTCTPGTSTGDIHLIYASPHMHQAGSHMKTVINRKAGGTEILVDEPFAFTDQRTYNLDKILKPGDTLTTTCTWANKTSAPISFGTSTTAEMCYNFVYAYPAHSLPNPLGGGIEGSSNMCLL